MNVAHLKIHLIHHFIQCNYLINYIFLVIDIDLGNIIFKIIKKLSIF